MKKSNSEFRAAFVSEAGGELANNDYFAYVELDDYACYVLASGITDFRSTEAAKLAVEHFILSFQENPSMGTKTLGRYMEETNQRLQQTAGTQQKLKASIIAVVTDYENVRYVEAGNVRLRMYRNGRVLTNSSDMSLAQNLVDRRQADTVLDKHEERHNLYSYLGKREFFRPYVSLNIPLQDGDILALYSSGFWEHVDALEIDEVFHEATNEPKASLDNLEDLLLARQPQGLKSYTVAAIFVNKCYRDPERERKRKRKIKIAIIVLVILLIVGLIAFFLHRYYQGKLADLKKTETETVEFMRGDNYLRAQASCQSALEQAKALKESEDEERMRNYLMVIDGILAADKALAEKDYVTAYDTYVTARENSKKADLMGMGYIESHIVQAEQFLYVGDLIALGNRALDAGEIERAEDAFYKARDKAAVIHDDKGRQDAIAALEKIYDEKTKQKSKGEEKIKKNTEAAVADAMKKGDDMMAKGDVEGAEKAYLEARAIANAGGDRNSRADAMKSLEQVHQVKAEKAAADAKVVDAKNQQYAIAASSAEKGDSAFASGDYISAQVYYQNAMDKFTALGETGLAEQMKKKLDLAVQKQAASTKSQVDAQNMETKAKELYTAGDYAGAKQAAISAKQMYAALGNQAKVDEMNMLISQIDIDAVIDKNLH